MAKQYVKDMTTGNELPLLLRFSLPMLVGNIFQQFYNMVDSIVVGNYVGTILYICCLAWAFWSVSFPCCFPEIFSSF